MSNSDQSKKSYKEFKIVNRANTGPWKHEKRSKMTTCICKSYNYKDYGMLIFEPWYI